MQKVEYTTFNLPSQIDEAVELSFKYMNQSTYTGKVKSKEELRSDVNKIMVDAIANGIKNPKVVVESNLKEE